MAIDAASSCAAVAAPMHGGSCARHEPMRGGAQAESACPRCGGAEPEGDRCDARRSVVKVRARPATFASCRCSSERSCANAGECFARRARRYVAMHERRHLRLRERASEVVALRIASQAMRGRSRREEGVERDRERGERVERERGERRGPSGLRQRRSDRGERTADSGLRTAASGRRRADCGSGERTADSGEQTCGQRRADGERTAD